MSAILNFLLGGGVQWGVGLAFLFAASMVVFAGIKLSKYGDALGERSGMGSGLVGLIFLAGVTSLPELVVSTTSTLSASLRAVNLVGEAAHSLLAGGADLAVGNMLGSNMFNLILIPVMDLVQGRGAMVYRLSLKHVLTAVAGLGLLGILLFGMAFGAGSTGVIPVLAVGYITPLLLAAYVATMILQSRMDQRQQDPREEEQEENAPSEEALVRMPAPHFYARLVGLALVIVLSGMWLSMLGDRLAMPWEAGGLGLGQSFIGTFFLAISTSLPELVICISAVRMGLLNMAAGNIFGSNIFNLVIVFIADIGLRGGSILHYAGKSYLITIAMVMILTCIAVIGMVYKSKKAFASLGYDAWLMVIVYIVGNLVIYL